MKRHIPLTSTESLCGRAVAFRDARRIREAYDRPANREGACRLCVKLLETLEWIGTKNTLRKQSSYGLGPLDKRA